MNGRMSSSVCARSPVAIARRVPARTRAVIAGFSGPTGSSIHSGSKRSSADATRTAVAGVKRPCISIEKLHVGADGLADGADDIRGAAQIGGGNLGARRAERVELHRAVAARDDARGERGDRGRLALGLVPAVGVRGNAIAEASAEQLPDRHAERLPHQVPAGDIERRERRLAHLFRPRVLGALDVPGEPLEVERIGADHVARRELVDARDERGRPVHHPDLGHAGQAGVGRRARRTRARATARRRSWCGRR